MSWDDLSTHDKAELIKLGVRNGITNLEIVKNLYQQSENKNLDESEYKYKEPTKVKLKDKIRQSRDYRREKRDIKRGIKYIQQYRDSEGFRERVDKMDNDISKGLIKVGHSNPKVKFINKPIEGIAISDRYDGTITFGRMGDNPDYTHAGVGAHEFSHFPFLYNDFTNLDSSNPDSPYYGLSYKYVPEFTKELLRPSVEVNPHDRELNENYSDLNSSRVNLFNDKIFDSRKASNVFTDELYEQYKNSPTSSKDRFFKNHTKDQFIKAINDVAYNKNYVKNPFKNLELS